MSRGIIVSQAQDFVSSTKVTTSTTATSVVFVPADGVQTGLNAKPAAIMSDEIVLTNLDTTNAVWIRFQTGVNQSVSQGIATTSAGQAGASAPQTAQQYGTQPISVDSSKFVAATAGTAGELYLPPSTASALSSRTLHVKAVGVSIIAAAGTPIVCVDAVGSANLV